MKHHRRHPQYFIPLHSIHTVGKSRFYEYALGRGDQSSSHKITCYNKMLFNLNDVIQGFSY